MLEAINESWNFRIIAAGSPKDEENMENVVFKAQSSLRKPVKEEMKIALFQN